jgi:hypothetical protein
MFWALASRLYFAHFASHPRRVLRVAMAPRRVKRCGVEALPEALLLAIFALLPLDGRAAACAALCGVPRVARAGARGAPPVDARAPGAVLVRGGRAAAAAVRRSLPRVARAHHARVLRAGCVRARYRLHALDVSGCAGAVAALPAVLAANARTLRQLRLWSYDSEPLFEDDDTAAWRSETGFVTPEKVRALLRAAPRLRVLEADLAIKGFDRARELLRNTAPFEPLRVRRLRVGADYDSPAFGHHDDSDDDAGGERMRNAALPLAAALAAHSSLQQLAVFGSRGSAALRAFVDASLARRLTSVSFTRCGIDACATPALARLLGSAALRTLATRGDGNEPLLTKHAAALLSVRRTARKQHAHVSRLLPPASTFGTTPAARVRCWAR